MSLITCNIQADVLREASYVSLRMFLKAELSKPIKLQIKVTIFILLHSSLRRVRFSFILNSVLNNLIKYLHSLFFLHFLLCKFLESFTLKFSTLSQYFNHRAVIMTPYFFLKSASDLQLTFFSTNRIIKSMLGTWECMHIETENKN